MSRKQITIAPWSLEDEERFWSKVQKGDRDDCWHCLAALPWELKLAL
jgi:hypothetical protein